MTALRCDGLRVGHGDGPDVLAGLDLAVGAGEAMAVLGPSGSGKSTLLYAVAGFLPLRDGSIELAGEVVAGGATNLPPERRSVGVVFQHHALWPHLDVLGHVVYPLRRRGLDRSTAEAEAARILERVGLAELRHRRPDTLSGGQQQRVSLARALARRPALFLFDEPTSSLDGPLRAVVQEEISEARRSAGAAALYSTHDAAEALAVADRVALLRDGRIVQTGSPSEVYERPVDLWAARLTGPASVVRLGAFERDPDAGPSGRTSLVRPEWTAPGGDLTGRVRSVAYRGPHTDVHLQTPGGDVVVRTPGPPSVRPGETMRWTIRRSWPIEA